MCCVRTAGDNNKSEDVLQMSNTTNQVLAVLYLNLGVEMMYVLDQRLRVQLHVSSDPTAMTSESFQRSRQTVDDREKSDKALKQIILGFLQKSTLDEVFRGHAEPTRKGMKFVFEKVAHCSYMRLSDNSMDKLFDLMMMAYKYALQKITMPEQV